MSYTRRSGVRTSPGPILAATMLLKLVNSRPYLQAIPLRLARLEQRRQILAFLDGRDLLLAHTLTC